MYLEILAKINKLKDVSGKMQQQSSNIFLCLARDSGGPM